MLQTSRIDGNTLSWVKSEIDQTIDDARQALESYVEDSQDESQLRFCLNYLHQIYGTLQMVELYGAGMLASEMERLTDALLENKVKNRNEAYEVLMRGMMQLPDYLERLQQGQADYPIVLLPLLNDLRASRGSPLLSEGALFSPNLEVDAPIPLERAEDSIDTLVRKLRHAYHLGLLDWFRDNDVKTGLKRISAVIERLRPAAGDPDTGRVLWAASGLVEALRDDGLNSSIAVKLLMGQIDREFKKIMDKGEFALSSEPPVELLKNLLYYVASSRSAGKRVCELKNAFQLKEYIPDTETLERARADLSAPNAALMRTVSSVLLEDLTQVKDSLDVFVRSENREAGKLMEMADKLSQMGDTLDMLGFGRQRVELQDQVSVLSAMASGERPIEENMLMDVAGSLLNIESVLNEPGVNPEATEPAAAEDLNDESIIRQFGNPEQRRLVKHVVAEVKVDLNNIKDAFNDYSRVPRHIDVLQSVPSLLDRIRGSLSMLTLNRASEILDRAATYVQTQIIDTSVRPDSHTLDLLAETISSVEYYLESLTEKWGHPTAILDVAEQRLSELGLQTQARAATPEIELEGEDQEDHSDSELIDLEMPEIDLEDAVPAPTLDAEDELTIDLSMDATKHDIVAPEQPVMPEEAVATQNVISLEGFGHEAGISLTPDTEDSDKAEIDSADEKPMLEPEALAQPEVSLDQDLEPESAATASQVSSTSAPVQSTLSDDLDDEIVEIFLEEADEEYGNISRLLPRWQNNPQDMDTLKELRRSFHTLKGSGRLVGAGDVGEFAWAFENMLNRVLDNSIQADEAMFNLLERARGMLPGMFDLFRNAQKPGSEIYTLMQQAEALSKGETLETDIDESDVEPEASTEQAEEATDSGLAQDADHAEGLNLDELSPDRGAIELAELEQPESDQTMQVPEVIEPVPGEAATATERPKSKILGIDPVLLGIYRKEIATHLQGLRDYIENWHNDADKTANYHLVRVLHTIKGSSRTANVPQIAELCNFLEEHAKYLQDGELNVGPELITLFADTVDFIEKTVSLLDQEGEELPDNAALVIRIRELLEQTRTDSPMVQIELPEKLSSQEMILAESEEPSSPSIELTIPEEEEWQPVVADYDMELLEIFLEEGVEILDESDHTLHEWINAPDNIELVKALQRQLHTLKGGARMAGVTEIGDLSHSIENMLTAVTERGLDVSEEMFRPLQKAQDRLVRMLDEIRENQRPRPATNLIHVIDTLAKGEALDEGDLQLDSAEISLPTEELASEEPEPVALESVEADLHDELSIEEPQEIDLTGVELPDTKNEDIEQTPPQLQPEAEDSPVEDAIYLKSVEIAEAEIDDIPSLEIENEEVAPTPPSTSNNVVQLEPKEIKQVPVTEASTDLAETTSTKPAAVGEEPEIVQPQQQRARGELIRVRSDLLDNLVNFAGEVSIYRSRMEQQTNAFRHNLTELDDTVSRLRGQLRQFEIEAETQIQYRIEETGTASVDFDPLEFDRFTQMQTLSRGMLESLNDLDSLRGILGNLTRESETLLLQQSRVNTDLQEGLMRTRMVPISGQIPRLRRIVRQTSEELGKKVEIQISGAENELDRTILERVMSPLEHMLRNAIAHGIEKPDVRLQAGKQDTGTIQLEFTREGSDLVIKVADDGAGINTDAIRNKAIERGILKPDAVVHKEDLLDFILQSGFSTAEEVTQVAGRGVGMDVVNSEIKQLGGLLNIKTEQGAGTLFTISMPMSLSVTRALMIHAGEETYAIPLLSVESVERVTREVIERMQSEPDGSYKWLENDYRYIHLGKAMGLTEDMSLPAEVKKTPILLVRSGDHRAAIHVDSLIGSREIVVKPVGPQLSTLRGIAGATIMGDGGVVLILDLGLLIRLSSVEREETFVEPEIVEPVVVEKHIPLVMVVDDSITVRKVTTRLLERNDFRTVSAKDGVDALAQLQEIKPDVMLLDVEMPRMDGFELATNIRNDQQLKDLPIIMITSRTGQKHRDRAMGIGVNIYMGKPYSEGELLDNVNNLLTQKD